MSNDGLSTASFMQGAMQGYKFMEGVEDNKLRREENKKLNGLRDAEEARRMESHNANMAFNNSRMKKIEREELEAIDKQFWRNSFLAETGNLNDDERKKLSTLTNGSRMANPEYLASDDVGFATDTYDKVRSGELDMNHPDAIRAANILVNVNRGAKDGRKLNLSRLVPSSGGRLHVGMDSTEADGTVRSNVPLTDGRSGDPKDTVAELSIDELDHYAGTVKQMRSAVMNPNIRKAMYMQYGFEKEVGEQEFTRREREAKLGLINAQAEHYRDKSGGAGGGATQRQKDYEFAISRLQMSPEAAKEWAFSDKTPSERAEDYANRQIAAEADLDEKPQFLDKDKKPLIYSPKLSWNKHREDYLRSYGSDGKTPPPQPEDASELDAIIKANPTKSRAWAEAYHKHIKGAEPAPKQEDPKPSASGDAGKKPEAQSEPAKPQVPAAQDATWLATQAERKRLLEESKVAKEEAIAAEAEARRLKNEDDQRRLKARQLQIAQGRQATGLSDAPVFSANGFDRK